MENIVECIMNWPINQRNDEANMLFNFNFVGAVVRISLQCEYGTGQKDRSEYEKPKCSSDSDAIMQTTMIQKVICRHVTCPFRTPGSTFKGLE
jgi:hypothetical protein